MKGKTFLNVSSFPPAPQEREERGRIQLSLVLRHIALGGTRLKTVTRGMHLKARSTKCKQNMTWYALQIIQKGTIDLALISMDGYTYSGSMNTAPHIQLLESPIPTTTPTTPTPTTSTTSQKA